MIAAQIINGAIWPRNVTVRQTHLGNPVAQLLDPDFRHGMKHPLLRPCLRFDPDKTPIVTKPPVRPSAQS